MTGFDRPLAPRWPGLMESEMLNGAPMPGEGLCFASSNALRRRAHRAIPGGCHTYAKGDDQYPVLAPGFIARGQGCHVWDVDGNEFIEYGMGNRAVGLGHAHPAVVAAARAALADGCNFTRPAPVEVECAERFLELVRTAEMVKFCKNGSDATSAAVRLARAATGRDLVAYCSEHPFFSTDDWFIGTTPMSAGIPEAVRRLSVPFHYNDIPSVETLFERYPGRIAAVILEPARTEEPKSNYLQDLKRLCCKNGALLIFDEMITGFRWHNGGAQAVYGVAPDLSCFGKALGNGFSVSALAGRRDVMQLGGIEQVDADRVFLLSTTHGAETHALAAAVSVMEVYRDEPVIEHLDSLGNRMRKQLEQVISTRGLSKHFKLAGRACCLLYSTLDADGVPSQAFRSLFLQETVKRGILAPSLVVSYAHSDHDVSRTVEAIDGALEVYAAALDLGVERFLVGRPSRVVFRVRNEPVEATPPALATART
jgi:glutamate-1-semialdehyde 2,1-aminomutase